ncbi:MAG: NAD(P)-dependent oxidoreductase [Pseudomonadota bacterium]
MRVLVTGATGFLGGAVVQMLREAGHIVIATGRSPVGCKRLADAGIQTHQVDLSAPTTGAAFGALDAVVHTAALSAPWGPRAAFEAANIVATRNVIAIARQAGVRRFVNISSPSVTFALVRA